MNKLQIIFFKLPIANIFEKVYNQVLLLLDELFFLDLLTLRKFFVYLKVIRQQYSGIL